MIGFEVGKKYAEIDKYLAEWRVTSRTKLFVTIVNNQGKTQRLKVWIHDNDGVESIGSLFRASFEVGSKSYLDFKNRVEIGNKKVAEMMQTDNEKANKFVNTLRTA